MILKLNKTFLTLNIYRVSRGYNGYVSSSAQPGPALNIQQGSNNFHNSYNNIQQQQQQQQHGGFVNNMTRMQHPAQQSRITVLLSLNIQITKYLNLDQIPNVQITKTLTKYQIFRLPCDARHARPGEPLQPPAALTRLPGLC